MTSSIAERVSRMTWAAEMAPRTSAGGMNCLRLSDGLSKKLTVLVIGGA